MFLQPELFAKDTTGELQLLFLFFLRAASCELVLTDADCLHVQVSWSTRVRTLGPSPPNLRHPSRLVPDVVPVLITAGCFEADS